MDFSKPRPSKLRLFVDSIIARLSKYGTPAKVYAALPAPAPTFAEEHLASLTYVADKVSQGLNTFVTIDAHLQDALKAATFAVEAAGIEKSRAEALAQAANKALLAAQAEAESVRARILQVQPFLPKAQP